MQAGRLNRRCQLQSPSQSVDELGQPIPGWTDVATVWASIKYQTGLGAIKAGADVSISRASIRVRHGAYSPGQRIVYGDETFSVLAVLPDGSRQHVDLVCDVINADT